MNPEIISILQAETVISPRSHPRLASSIRYLAEKGDLKHVLGGHYSTKEMAETFEVRLAAARAVHPNGVFVRETAARLTWWDTLNLSPVQMATSRRHPVKGFAFERRSIPEELRVWDGTAHFISDPALTVLDLTDSLGPSVISDALRRGTTTVEGLNRALELTRCRPGNQRRAQMIREARDEPWSELEREAHVMLRKAHFPGWVANHPVIIAGKLYFIDLAVPDLNLAVEVDGWVAHKSYEVFVSDRIKWNALTRSGWTVLHFTAVTMEDLVPEMQEVAAKLRTG